MKDVLGQIAASTKRRYAVRKESVPLEVLRDEIDAGAGSPLFPHAFERALRGAGFAIICEIKKASPSKGVISADFPYIEKTRDYVRGGAAAISCLTEPEYFLGSDEIFKAVREVSPIPILRKDFVVDEYQIYESKVIGADAVLLISSLLSAGEMEKFLSLTRSLGMSALCECRTEEEVKRAVDIGARVIGVNNRDLTDFSVDRTRAESFINLVPEDRVFITESGMSNAVDVRRAYKRGFGGVLMGEALMRADDAYMFLCEVKECVK
ncbi:MAG: indole-3-glycerol phosphate synthase TrpC [Clostridia bacterium]|nr:indole-3-glycerol phosphate synthase TrpC [Clostridia bacterium]